MKAMGKNILNYFTIILLFFAFQMNGLIFSQSSKDQKLSRDIEKRLKNYPAYFENWRHLGKIKLDTIVSSNQQKTINLYFNAILAYTPVRESYVDSIQSLIKHDLGKKYRSFHINIYSNKRLLEEFIPNYYRYKIVRDESRYKKQPEIIRKPLVSYPDHSFYSKGLQGCNIALWHSHGWYYEARLDRWEWQRARLFGTVEDISPMTYVLPFIAPMLENAGATTFIPRERDTHPTEIIIDNDYSSGKSEFFIINQKEEWKNESKGFAWKDTLYNDENPFELGTYLSINASKSDTAKVIYFPEIPEDGEYAVYLSWVAKPNNSDAVHYMVYHAGGQTPVIVNQQIGGKTWIYIGKFPFYKGKNYERGRIELINICADGSTITADAIKIGGGTGSIARRPANEYVSQQWSLSDAKNPSFDPSNDLKQADYSWKLSDKARYLEGARYFLQYAGMPPSVYSPNQGKNDYNDDYQSRGDWVNYLMGQHVEPALDSALTGLQIPIDLSLAFHTDAGVKSNDSIIGTLAIYNTLYGDTVFPDGSSRMRSRDLSDLIQTQIVSDIRSRFNPEWTRRGLWDKSYSEAWRPKVPAMLLELLSHQNLADVKFSLDPRYRFAVSRAIYKGILRFLAEQNKREYVVQPLAPDHFSIQIMENKRVRLNWQPVSDPLEITAEAKLYKVYMREGDLGFDSGTQTDHTSLDIDLSKENTIYSFKVKALNEGGESFPSETLSVGIINNGKKPVLIVNSFDRISGPEIIDGEDIAGIAWWNDQGVPMISDIGFTGKQYDYERSHAWLDDDNPGWGASYADMEGKIIPGNTFDFTIIHGKSVMNAGYSFVSASNEIFEKNTFDPGNYSTLDIIFGEQRSTPDYIRPEEKNFVVYTPGMMESIRKFADAQTPVFISGAYTGTDMVENKDSMAMRFTAGYLHYSWQTNHADNMGQLKRTDLSPSAFPETLHFNTKYNPAIYTVEAPDAIEPAGKEAVSLYRYTSNNTSAGVIYSGKNKTIVLGFPFETILDEKERDELMKAIINSEW